MERKLMELGPVICPMVTPFTDENGLDLDAAAGVVDFLIEKGVRGLMVAGTTGEGMMQTPAERKMLLDFVVRHAAGRAAVVAHVGAISTAETVELAQHAQALGVAALSAIVPYFFTFDDESLFLHFTSLARAVPELPVMIYSFPGNAKNDISTDLLAQLMAAAPNICGLKITSPNLLDLQELKRTGGQDFVVYCGIDGLMLPALALGARGQVAGNANAFPELFVGLAEAFQEGNLELARTYQTRINQVRRMLKDGMHPAYFKYALKLRGVPAGCVRAPMRELSREEADQLEEAIETALKWV